ncbi:hypothetical protein D2Q93_15910 [Alicyclobacillaceae bacterium I2511]|nr:hypothetical protein D2Q93_15910 [Alicyclobacillaceae bacterium I2511]
MKKTLTGIAATTVALGTMLVSAAPSFAATNALTWSTKTITAGTYTATPKGFAAKQSGSMTTFMPLYYVQQALKALGYQASWSGSVLSVVTPTGVTPDFSNISVGSGNASIYVNGTLVKKVDTMVEGDPASGGKVKTTYMPIYYIDALLQAAGLNATWNGSGWNIPKPTAVTQSSSYTLSPVTVTGETVGTGADASPAVAVVNQAMTFSTTVTDQNGNPVSSTAVQFLVSTTSNLTAYDGSGNVLNSATLSAPIVLGTKTYNAYYTVPVSATGVASVKIVDSSSSTTPLYVLPQLPAPINGQYVRAAASTAEWGLPGTLVLAPLYSSGQPDQINFSTTSNATQGLIPMVATMLPSTGSTASVANQQVKFTITVSNTGNVGNPQVFATDATGTQVLSGGVADPTTNPTITYLTQTNAQGQALMYINSDVPTTNGVPQTGAIVTAQVNAALINGGSSIGNSYIQWAVMDQPAQLANISPGNLLNSPDLTDINRETGVSGSTVTISGQVQDAAGNPVPNVPLLLTDANLSSPGALVGADGTDSYVVNGTTTTFSGSSFPMVTTDSNGDFSFTVSDVTNQQQQQQVDTYYVYYAPSTSGVVPDQQLPSGLVPLEVIGGQGNGLQVSWEPGTSVGAIGVSGTTLSSSYSGLSAVPTTLNIADETAGGGETMYWGAFNQSGSEITAGQYPQDQLTWNVNVAQGYTFNNVIGATLDSSSGMAAGAGNDLLTYLNANNSADYTTLSGKTYDVTAVSYSEDFAGGVVTPEITGVQGYTYNGATPTAFNFTGLSMPVTNYQPGMALVNTSNYTNSSTNINGGTATININVQVQDLALASGNQAQGGASGSGNIQFLPGSGVLSIGLGANEFQLENYEPLQGTNSGLPAAATVQGAAWQTLGGQYPMSNMIVAPFSQYVNLSAIPPGGLTYNVSTPGKSDEYLSAVDGVMIPGAQVYGTSVSVLPNGSVQMGGQNLWNAIGGQNIVGYGQSATGQLYVLGQSTTPNTDGTYTFTLYKMPGATNSSYTSQITDAAGNAETVPAFNLTGATGTAIGTANITPITGANAQAVGFSIGTNGQLTVNYISGAKVALQQQTSVDSTIPTSSDAVNTLFTPVQVVTVGADSEYTGTWPVTFTEGTNKAVMTANFVNPSGSVVRSVVGTPLNIQGTNAQTQSLQLTALDINGNPAASQTIDLPVSPSLQGLWITAVNGVALQTSVNMGTNTSTNFQNEPSPVPMWAVNTATTPLNYNTVTVPGAITASNLNTSTPTVQVTTDNNGNVTLLLEDGSVTYAGTQTSNGTTIGSLLTAPYSAINSQMVITDTNNNVIGGEPVQYGGTSTTPVTPPSSTALITNASATFDGVLETAITGTVNSAVTSVTIVDSTNGKTLMTGATPSNGTLSESVIGAAKGDTLVLTPYEGTTAEATTSVVVQ